MPELHIKTRFAPSPTGHLHLGNLRTALFSFLHARRMQGEFLLRIEDTDASRSTRAFQLSLEDDLRWLGLVWDEGPGVGGNSGPYLQSLRGGIYADLYGRLLTDGAAYPYFCSQETLSAARKAQVSAGRPPRYPGTCTHLGAEEVSRRMADGESYSLRFRVPSGVQLTFEDLVMGVQRFSSDDIGDFVIQRSDGSPAFFFSNAVDDALMGVTHVLRGADHVSNTPRQMLLLRALELDEPRYGHLSLIVGEDGSPLSKRHGADSLGELRDRGYLPLALLNHLARLGHGYQDDSLLDAGKLAEGFDLGRLGKSPARHDISQLNHWQKLAVSALDAASLRAWAGDACERIPENRRDEFLDVIRDNILFPEEVAAWARKLFDARVEASPEALEVLMAAPQEFFDIAIKATHACPDDFRAFSAAISDVSGLKGKALFMPLRAAMTGQVHGPEMARIYPLLGSELVRQRIEDIHERLLAG